VRHGAVAQAAAVQAAAEEAAEKAAAEKFVAAKAAAEKAAAEKAAEKAAAEKAASEKAAALMAAAQKAAVEKAAAEKAAAVKVAAEKAAEKAAAEKAAAEKAAAERAASEKAAAIRVAVQTAAAEKAAAAKRESGAPRAFFPKHWSAAMKGGSASALSLVHVKDGGVLNPLQACLEGTDIGCCGKDQKYYDGSYENLVLKEAWRVENTGLWQSYQGAQNRAIALEPWAKESLMNEKIRPELYRSSGKLPGGLVQSCNEVL